MPTFWMVGFIGEPHHQSKYISLIINFYKRLNFYVCAEKQACARENTEILSDVLCFRYVLQGLRDAAVELLHALISVRAEV